MYEVALNESVYGISTLAAPVFGQNDEIAGAIGIVGSSYVIPADPDDDLIATVQRSARFMSEALGSNGWAALEST